MCLALSVDASTLAGARVCGEGQGIRQGIAGEVKCGYLKRYLRNGIRNETVCMHCLRMRPRHQFPAKGICEI